MPKAFKQLARLPKTVQVSIRDSVNAKLPDFPNCAEVKALKNHRYGYRLRVGNYRVLFDFDGTITVVSIQEVRKRDERTY
jgi:mRNA-degrading endonuclease RelE of RelBE toxin-antitoxin system